MRLNSDLQSSPFGTALQYTSSFMNDDFFSSVISLINKVCFVANLQYGNLIYTLMQIYIMSMMSYRPFEAIEVHDFSSIEIKIPINWTVDLCVLLKIKFEGCLG